MCQFRHRFGINLANNYRVLTSFRPLRQVAGMLLSFCFFYSNPSYTQVNGALAATLSLSHSFDFNPESFYGPASDSAFSASRWVFADWDNRRFNPYKAENVKFPIKVTFMDTTYAMPMARKMVVTSRYGWRNGELHRGIDLDLVTGDEVYALLDGKVRYVKYHAGHGKTVVIRHANGLETIYAHLSKQVVKENDVVKKGEIIGKGGTTGNARGSHLHLEVRYQGRTLNPEYFFDFTKGDRIRSRTSWITKTYANPRNYSSVRPSSLPILTNDPAVKVPKQPKEEKLVQRPSEPKKTHIHVEKDVVSAEPASTEKTKRRTESQPYTIKYGDTLYSLARVHRTTVDAICKYNGIPDAFKIKVGQKIILDF